MIINPDYDSSYYNLALTYNTLHETDSAFRYFDKAIRVNPVNPAFYENRRNLYYSLNKNKKAILDYDRAIDLEPSNKYYYIGLELCKD